MSTGSIQSASKTLYKNKAGIMCQTFIASADLVQGQPVKISGNGTVAPAGATDLAIGFCEVGGLNGERVTINVTIYSIDALVIMKGGTATAGGFVVHNGTVTGGVPEVVTAVSTNKVKGIILSGGAANAEIRIGLLNFEKVIA